MLRRLKLMGLEAASSSGWNERLLDTPWRRDRLLILCYHGFAQSDEHAWDPSLYMPPDLFRKRLEIVRDSGCTVLPLAEALERLDTGALPPRSVVITVDDGTYDFYKLAVPILREFGFPATLYLTTYYSEHPWPVFDVMSSYLLWKARGAALKFPEIGIPELPLDDAGRSRAHRAILDRAKSHQLSGRAKNELLADLASRLHIDFDELCANRILHLITPDEARQLAGPGDIVLQLHTHRHRTSRNRDLLRREIEDNRQCIAHISNHRANHFCYPGGFYLPEFPAWLREFGVVSATTCQPGLVTRDADRMLLPRLIDTTHLESTEFHGWLSGLASLLPKRKQPMSEGQLLEA